MNRVSRVIFTSLLIDLLAFTMILPLFPRILDFYSQKKDPSFDYILSLIQNTRIIFHKSDHMDIVLFGGLVGSMFSFLQFIVSPFIGKASDLYGRKRVLMVSMIGNLLSMLCWILAEDFKMFLLSRIIGGLTEGNVQLSIAMISDISTPKDRSKGLAMVGVCFAVAFSVGPPLGAYLSNYILSEKNHFQTPALFASVLVLIETIYMHLYLPETKAIQSKNNEIERTETIQIPSMILASIHFLYLFIFSGMEFTLTFLTFDLFKYSNSQQGRLLAFFGICTSFVQGGYVRRQKGKETRMVLFGLMSCFLGLSLIGTFDDEKHLYLGVFLLSIASGTVITCLTSLASFGKEDEKGMRLGMFRSSGQLGRAIGPLFTCSLYWVYGKIVYFWGGLFMLILLLLTTLLFTNRTISKIKKD